MTCLESAKACVGLVFVRRIIQLMLGRFVGGLSRTLLAEKS